MFFNNLITTGCSFTAGTSNIQLAKKEKTTWAHYLLEPWNVTNFINLAIPGCSNIASSFNMKHYVLKYIDNFSYKDTIIIFNLTGLDRYDLLVEHNHIDANNNFSWNKDNEFDWITSGGFLNENKHFQKLQRTLGYENIVRLNQMAIIDLFNFLEHLSFPYAFMCMDNDILTENTNEFFVNYMNKKTNKLITFNNLHMYEFCKTNLLLEEDNFHPNKQGHEEIAKYIISYFKYKD